jgi:hypothetical protein
MICMYIFDVVNTVLRFHAVWLQYALDPNHCLSFLITFDNCLFTDLPLLYHFLRTPYPVVSTFRIPVCLSVWLSTYFTLQADIFDRRLRLDWTGNEKRSSVIGWPVCYETLPKFYCLKLIQFYVGTTLLHRVKLKSHTRLGPEVRSYVCQHEIWNPVGAAYSVLVLVTNAKTGKTGRNRWNLRGSGSPSSSRLPTPLHSIAK